MNDGASSLVWWILIPLFVAVALYMIWYTRRRRRMLETFAYDRQLRISPELETDVQRILDEHFSLDSESVLRQFGQVSSVIDGGPIRLFRTVELLDLDRFGTAQSTHTPRIAALVDVAATDSACFVLDTAGEARPLVPGSRPVDSKLAVTVMRIGAGCNVRHSLTLTVERGKALVYSNPLVTGGETAADVGALYCVAEKIRDEI